MKTTVYFMRHGEVYNPKNILYGRKPGFPLSENGKRMIQELAKAIKHEGIEHIYTSPILRTRQTASIIGGVLNIAPRISRLLIETNDVLSGIPLKKFQKEVEPHLYERKYLQKGQESIESQETRMMRFIRKITLVHTSKKILAVSHGDPIMILRAKLEGKIFSYEYKKSHYIQTGQYFILDIKDGMYKWHPYT